MSKYFKTMQPLVYCYTILFHNTANHLHNTDYFLIVQFSRNRPNRFLSVTVLRRIQNRGERKMFYLTTHTTYFYLRLYGVRHMVKDHSDSEKGNPLPPHRLLLSINSKGSFICTIEQTGLHIPRPLLHQSWCNWVEREIAQWVHPKKDRSDDPSHHELRPARKVVIGIWSHSLIVRSSFIRFTDVYTHTLSYSLDPCPNDEVWFMKPFFFYYLNSC